MLTTTLNKILKANPCMRGWCKLTGQLLPTMTWQCGNDEPLTIASILKSNGVYDAMWACRHAHDEARFEEWLARVRRDTEVPLDTFRRTVQLYSKVSGTFYIDINVFMREFNYYLEGDDNGN